MKKKYRKQMGSMILVSLLIMLAPLTVLAEENIGETYNQNMKNDSIEQMENTMNSDDEEQLTDKTEKESSLENQEESSKTEYSQETIVNSEEKNQTEEPALIDNDEQEKNMVGVNLNYQAHVQRIGWQEKVSSGEMAGTTGKSLNLEALRINLLDKNNNILEGAITYQAHVQTYGWQNKVSNGEMAGTTGLSKRIEALKINLGGELAEKYDVYYRVHSANYGWLGWAKNGETAGTIGFGLGAQAVEIRLYEKDANDKPEQNAKSYISLENLGKILYKTHVQRIGWQPENFVDGQTAGTTGQSCGMEALTIKVTELGRMEELTGSIVYQAHVQSIGWQPEVSDGQMAGTTGQSKRMEAIRIHLTGELAEKYDVYYRTHSAKYGWLGWTKNGEIAGTVGYSKAIEAIEIKLVEKGIMDAPQISGRSYLAKELAGQLEYNVNIENTGWQGKKSEGEISGTTGQDKAITNLEMNLVNQNNTVAYTGNIEYRLHVNKLGWLEWKHNKEGAGNNTNRAEAVQIRLTGELAEYMDIYYRVHVSQYGWLGWAKNGQEAGTTALSYKLQAIQVKIVPKGAMAPGSNSNYYITMTPQQIRINNGIQNVYNQAGRNLYSCFMWCVNNIKYRTLGDNPGTGYTNPQWFALYGLEQQIGDCRTYAATFYQLAKGLGYNARYVYGYVPRAGGGMVDHAWVEIDISGVTYVYDADFQHETGRNGYQFRYKTSGTWVYTNYHYES